KMSIRTLRLYIFAMLLLGSALGCGNVLEPFGSIEELSTRASWVGVVRVEEPLPPTEGLRQQKNFTCSALVTLKGDDLNGQKFECELVDASARSNKGKILEAVSQGVSFHKGELYLVFLQGAGAGRTYVPMEGSVLQLPPRFSPENLRGLPVASAFARVVK